MHSMVPKHHILRELVRFHKTWSQLLIHYKIHHKHFCDMFEFSFVFLVHMSLSIDSMVPTHHIWKELLAHHKTWSQ